MNEINSYYFVALIAIAIVLWLIRDRRLRFSKEVSKAPQFQILNPAQTKTETKKMKDSNSVSILVQSYLTEYQTLREEFLKRVEFSSQVQVYSVLLLSATLPLIEYVTNAASKGTDAYSLFLLAALVFCSLGWYQLDLDDKVADLDNYVLLELTPRLRAVLSLISGKSNDLSEHVLGWHIYWRSDRYKSWGGRWLSLGVVGRTGVPVIGASALLGSYIYNEHIILGTSWNLLSGMVVAFVGFAIAWIVISGLLVTNKFRKAADTYRELAKNR